MIKTQNYKKCMKVWIIIFLWYPSVLARIYMRKHSKLYQTIPSTCISLSLKYKIQHVISSFICLYYLASLWLPNLFIFLASSFFLPGFKGGGGGGGGHFLNFPKILLHCVPLYVCRLCINFQDLCASLLEKTALRILVFTFISTL